MPLPPDARPGDPIRAKLINEIKEALLSEIIGDGLITVRRSGPRMTIGFAGRVPGVLPLYLIRVSGIEDQGQNQYFYDYVEIELTPTGVQDKAGGITGSVADGTHARNLRELYNTGDGTEGNGVDVDNLEPGFSFQPLPINSVEWLTFVRETNDNRRGVIGIANAVDGACL